VRNRECGRGRASSDSRDGPVSGSCETGNETSGSVKGVEYLHHLSDCHFLRKNYVSWIISVGF
jgi:hypothetical protein